ncbi:MAG: short chain dehydrogenase [Simkaniaceae bacterium]|nr:short chain dehydrogenase [Simkaniaceae bacterium]
MKVIVVGASGTIGKGVVEALRERRAEVVCAGRSSGDVQVDLESSESIQKMYEQVGVFDALVCAAGGGMAIKAANEMSRGDYAKSFEQKLLGQIDLVLSGLKYINAGGSFTLTSGVLNEEFVPKASAIAVVNTAVEAFVRSASLEMPVRLNAVSPKLLEESKEKYSNFLIGFEGAPSSQVALSYLKCVYGIIDGTIVKVR